MPLKVLHLSHTDINQDARIIKEINEIARQTSYQVFGIGVQHSVRSANTEDELRAEIITVQPKIRRWQRLNPVIRHLLVWFEVAARMVFKGLRLRPNVIHCHDYFFLPVGLLLKLLLRARLIYDAHELESQVNGLSYFSSRAIFFIERMSWNFIDKFITVSPSIIRWYSENLGKKECYLVMNSPLLTNNIIHKADNNNFTHLRRRFQIPDKDIIFLYLGALGPGRGIDLIINYFSRHQGRSHVVFIGYGEYEKKILESAKLNPNIHLHPPVPHEQVVTLASQADVGLCLVENVSLSDFYCLPNKLFEYAFARLPVVGSELPEISRIIRYFELGITINNDHNSLAMVVKKIEENPLPKCNSDLELLTWDAQARVLMTCYSEIEASIRPITS